MTPTAQCPQCAGRTAYTVNAVGAMVEYCAGSWASRACSYRAMVTGRPVTQKVRLGSPDAPRCERDGCENGVTQNGIKWRRFCSITCKNTGAGNPATRRAA